MRKGTLTGIALLVLAVCMAGGFLYALNASRPPVVDAETRCPALPLRGGLTLILVDSTSALSPESARALRAHVKMALADIPGFGEVRVGALSGGAGSRGKAVAARPGESRLLWLLTRCAPERVDEANPLISNRDKLAAAWISDFESPVLRAVGRARSRAESADSRIVAALRMAAAQSEFGERSGKRRVILASDLIERNGEWGLDQPEASWPEPADIAARFFAESQAGDRGNNDWSEVEITAFVLPRPAAALPGRAERREEWWRAFFSALGAEGRIVPL